jgi:CBS domain containing-hemolysin-like protein
MPDVPQVLLGLLAIMTLVLANGFFVAAEFALVTVRKTRIDQLIAEGSATARVVRRALGDPDSYIAATQLGITMTSLGLGWIGEPALAVVLEPGLAAVVGDRMAVATSHSIAFTVAFAIITALHIVLGELAPKTVALQHPERTSLIVARPTELFMRVFWPFIRLLNGIGRAIVTMLGLRGSGGHAMVHSEEELKMLVTASQEAGVLEEREEQMLHRVFDFADLTAGQVMVPRTELVAVPSDLAGDALLQAMGRAGYSTIPVYRENLDNIVGMLHAIDVVKALAGGQKNVNAGAVARETLNVPEAMGADDLLASLHQRGVREAVVIDEYGGTAGLVTFEWLMQRIVGAAGVGDSNIHPDGSADVDGLALVGDVNAQFGLHIDEDVYNTLGGYVLGRLGRRARLGDRIEVEGRTMRVEALDGLRVARVFISKRRAEHA